MGGINRFLLIIFACCLLQVSHAIKRSTSCSSALQKQFDFDAPPRQPKPSDVFSAWTAANKKLHEAQTELARWEKQAAPWHVRPGAEPIVDEFAAGKVEFWKEEVTYWQKKAETSQRQLTELHQKLDMLEARPTKRPEPSQADIEEAKAKPPKQPRRTWIDYSQPDPEDRPQN